MRAWGFVGLVLCLPSTPTNARDLSDCVASLRRGLDFVRAPASIPTRNEQLVDAVGAIHFVERFNGDLEHADGTLYRKEAQAACGVVDKEAPKLSEAGTI